MVRAGQSDLFLTEACEFKASFLTLHPSLALVLNVDADHLDYYRDIDHIQATFAKFLTQVRPGGLAVLCADQPSAPFPCARAWPATASAMASTTPRRTIRPGT